MHGITENPYLIIKQRHITLLVLCYFYNIEIGSQAILHSISLLIYRSAFVAQLLFIPISTPISFIFYWPRCQSLKSHYCDGSKEMISLEYFYLLSACQEYLNG
jgi:hypothetical protein